MASWLISLALLAAGAVFLLSGLAAFANFAWPQPMFKPGTRMYPDLFRPFPENVLQALNGHRPILPNLIRVGEMAWLGGDQGLQKAISVTCPNLAGLPGFSHRLAQSGTLAPAAGRMHGRRSRQRVLDGQRAHVHARQRRLACLSAGNAAAVRCCCGPPRQPHLRHVMDGRSHNLRSVSGSGIAAFPALILLAWISRVSMQEQAILVGGLLLALILYLGILPGDNEVRSVLSLQPLESMRLAARWLASPLVQAWMGFADPAFHGWMDNAPNKLAQVAWLRRSRAWASSYCTSTDWVLVQP